jgi:uncharacterized protein (DUF488 family)
MPRSASTSLRSAAELTRAVLGVAMTFDQVEAWLQRFEQTADEMPKRADDVSETIWVGSAGYERHKDNREFAQALADAGVERLVDVRELPISRRRGYAKSALMAAMAEAGVEYVHVRALGNPKPFRDLYKAGRTSEGRAAYEAFLLDERQEALAALAELLREKPAALMCVEHDSATCHRTVILEALRSRLSLDLVVAEVP